jgi:hypothetical protein
MNRWTWSAVALAAALAVGVGACMWGVPLPLSDNLVLMLEVQHTPLLEGLRTQSSVHGLLRPLFWAQYKLLFELSQGHYYLVFQGFHVLMFAATLLLGIAAMRVRSAAGFVGASAAIVTMLGLHTFGNLVREQPITVVTCCALAMWLAFAERPARWRDGLAIVNLVVAMFFVEIGLLVFVIHACAWLLGRRGISLPALAVLAAAFAGYFVVRFLVLPVGAPTAFPRGTGFGTRYLEVAELKELFGSHPLALYAYNIASSVASVLFSEPRTGVFDFVRRFAAGELRPWMWLNVLTSTATTAGIAWFLVRSRHEWRRFEFSRDHALVLVCLAVVVANAVISFPYSRDVTMSAGGLCYALAVAPTVAALSQWLPARQRAGRVLLAAVLVAVTAGWTLRTVALTYSLRYTAFIYRNDWAGADAWLRRIDRVPQDEIGRRLVTTLKNEALGTVVPNPLVSQPLAEFYLGHGGN